MNNYTYSQYRTPTAVVQDPTWNTALETLQIRHKADLFPLISPKELLRRHSEIETITRDNSLSVRFLGYNILPKQVCVYPGEKSDWAIMNLKSDPVFYANGESMIIPDKVALQIRTIVNAGIEFDAIYIAHEIPKSSVKPGQPVPLELIAPPPPPETMYRVRKLGNEVDKFWKKIAAISTTTVAATAAAFAALTPVDPVLFGVNINEAWKLKNTPVGMWYYIARWDW